MSLRLMNIVWKTPLGDPQAKLILLKLADCADKDGICWPSLSTISSDTDLHRATVCRKIDKLESDGMLRRERFKNGCRYDLSALENLSQPATTSTSQPVAQCDHLEEPTSRTQRPVAHSDQSRTATQVVAHSDTSSRTVRLSITREPSGTVIEPQVEGGRKAPADEWADDSDVRPLVSLKAAVSHATFLQLSAEEVEHWWHIRNAAGWTRGTEGGGHPRKITSWQSDLKSSTSWIRESIAKARNQPSHRAAKAQREYPEIFAPLPDA